jgi:hypothetical protein
VFSTGLRGVGVGEEMTRGCVLTTFLWGVDYTQREKRKTEREREKLHYITCGPTTQREEIFFLEK